MLFWLPVVGIALLGCVRFGGKKGAGLLALVAVAICTLSCGGSGPQNHLAPINPPIIPPTTQGTYVVTVTGTSGASQHSAVLTVTVTP